MYTLSTTLYTKSWGARLVDDTDATLIDIPVFDDVALCTFADGDDVVGLAKRLTELPGIDLRVEPVVVLRMTQEDEVVYGHHTLDAALADANGKLAGESVVELNTVAKEILHDTVSAPESSEV